jgi:hypothetical protein
MKVKFQREKGEGFILKNLRNSTFFGTEVATAIRVAVAFVFAEGVGDGEVVVKGFGRRFLFSRASCGKMTSKGV